MRERMYRPVKPWMILGLAILFAAAAAVGGMALYARSLLLKTLEGRQMREIPALVTQFSLREQMVKSQVDTRVRGWQSIVQREEVFLETARGELHASLFAPIGETEDAPWALALHGGLGTDRRQMLDVACELSLSGYTVLTPDLHAHGSSEGEIASLGLADAQDVNAWVQWIISRDADARIVLFGQDEGGAAVLLAAAQGMPSQVRAAAADSAYTSVKGRLFDLLAGQSEDAGALEKKLLAAAYRMKHGINVGEGELMQRLGLCELPLLLLHGTGDADVPAWHGEDLAVSGKNAELVFVEGAGHGMARYADPEKYYGALLDFYAQALEE